MKTCQKCHANKQEPSFPKRGFTCKQCHNEYNRIKRADGYRGKTKTPGSIEHFIASHWQSIKERTVNSGSKIRGHEAYRREGIRLEMSKSEFELWVGENWDKILEMSSAGVRPTIDRKESDKNYAIDNLQILSYSENSAKDKWRPVTSINPITGEKITYSTTNQAVANGFDRRCIQSAISRGTMHRGLNWKRDETEKAIKEFAA